MKLTLRQMVLYALLGALMFVFKLALAPLPNIEPVSLMIIAMAACLGAGSIAAVFIYILLECLVYGFSLWSISYLYVWPLLFLVARLLQKHLNAIGAALLSTAFGLAFGGLCALVQIPVSGLSGAYAWWLAGIPFDLFHAAGNFVMALLLFVPLKTLLIRLKKSI